MLKYFNFLFLPINNYNMKSTSTFLVLLFWIFASLNIAKSQQHYVVDKSFGETCGISSIPTNAKTFEIFKTPEGKYLVVGEYYSNAENAFYILFTRFNENGKIDSSFGNNGTITKAFDQRNTVLSCLQKNNKIYVAGIEAPGSAYSTFRAYVAKFNLDGTPDSTFNGIGRVVELTSTNPISSSYYSHVAVQDDGKVIAFGSETGNINGGATNVIARRYLPNGTIDNTFHPSITYPGINQPGGFYCSPGIISADNSIRFIYSGSVNNKLTIIKLNANGELDNSFGMNGINEINLTTNNDASTILRNISDADGSIYAQTSATSDDYDIRVVKFKLNGDLDSSFSNDGFQDLIDYPGTNLYETGFVLHKDSQNRIWSMGAGSFAFTEPKGIIYRLNENGEYDTTLEGTGYRAFTQIVSTTFKCAYFESDNEIVINTISNGQISLIKLKLIDEIITIQNSGLDTICSNDAAFLSIENPSACYNYRWKKNGTEVEQPIDFTLTASGTGVYTVVAEDGVDTLESNAISITVVICAGLNKVNDAINYAVSPNPFANTIKILNAKGTESYQLINGIGEIIFSGKNISEQDFSTIAEGIYFLQISDGNKRQVSKIVKM